MNARMNAPAVSTIMNPGFHIAFARVIASVIPFALSVGRRSRPSRPRITNPSYFHNVSLRDCQYAYSCEFYEIQQRYLANIE